MTEELTELDEDTQEAIKWIASQYNFSKKLVQELELIKKEQDPKKAETEAQKAEKIFAWIGRGEPRTKEYEERIINGLKKIGQYLPKELRDKEEEYVHHLSIAQGMLVQSASRFTSQIKKKIHHLEKDEHLLQGLDPKHHQKIIDKVKKHLKKEIQEIEAGVEKLTAWIRSSEAILEGEIRPFVKKMTEVSKA